MFFFKNKPKSNKQIADDLLDLYDNLRKEKSVGFLYVEYGNLSRVLSALDFKKVVSTSQGILYSNAYGLAAVVKDSLYISYVCPVKEEMSKTGILSFFNRDSEPTHLYGFKVELNNHWYNRIDDFTFLQASLKENGHLIPRDSWIPKIGWDLSQIIWDIVEEGIQNNKKFKDSSVLEFFQKSQDCDFHQSERNYKTLTKVVENVYWAQLPEAEPPPFPPSEEMQRNLKSLCDFMIYSPQNNWQKNKEFIESAFDFHPLVPLLHLSVSMGFKEFPFEHQRAVHQAIEDIVEFTSKEELQEIWEEQCCGPSITFSIFKEGMDYKALSQMLELISKKIPSTTSLLNFNKNNAATYYLCHGSSFCSDASGFMDFLNQGWFPSSNKASQVLNDVADLLQSHHYGVQSKLELAEAKENYEVLLRKCANQILIKQNLKPSHGSSIVPNKRF